MVVEGGELTWFQELRKPRCPLSFHVRLDRPVVEDFEVEKKALTAEEAAVSKQTSH